MAKVSVIIPVFNVERYLAECMDSVRNQTLADLEIICVNDGSTDRSAQMLREYREKDDRIVLIEQENQGYGCAMNRGLARASGEYVGIVEPDDYVSLAMYQELYRTAAEYNLDFVKADFYRFRRSEEGSMELTYNHLSSRPEDYNRVFDPSSDPERLRYVMNTWSGIYRREFLEKHHIRHNETPGASFQDNGFWIQTFVYARRAMIVDKPYYMNRRDNPDSSINSREKVYCVNIEYDHIRDLLMRDPQIWERFRYMYWYKKYYNYIGTLERIGEEYKHEYLMRFSEEFRRASALGELKRKVFSELAWDQIRRIMEDPEEYYISRIYPQAMDRKVYERIKELDEQNRKLRKEIAGIRASFTFRIGKALLYVPGKIRRALAKRRK